VHDIEGSALPISIASEAYGADGLHLTHIDFEADQIHGSRALSVATTIITSFESIELTFALNRI
jgi:hypothetical protein